MKTFASVALFAGILLIAVGCSSGPKRVKVSGKVTYKGEPVPVGSVSFVSEHNVVANGDIVNGEYTIANAPVGNVKIGITTPTVSTADEKMQQKQKVEGKSLEGAAAKSVAVPDSYREAETSGLSYKVTDEANQTHDIPLK